MDASTLTLKQTNITEIGKVNITKEALRQTFKGVSLAEKIVSESTLETIPKEFLDADIAWLTCSNGESLLNMAAKKGQLLCFREDVYTNTAIKKWTDQMREVVYNAIEAKKTKTLPKTLLRPNLLEICPSRKELSPIGLAVRVGNIEDIPRHLFTAENVFQIENDGRNMITGITKGKDQKALGPNEKDLLSKLFKKLSNDTLETIALAYRDLKTMVTLEKMRRVVGELSEEENLRS